MTGASDFTLDDDDEFSDPSLVPVEAHPAPLSEDVIVDLEDDLPIVHQESKEALDQEASTEPLEDGPVMDVQDVTDSAPTESESPPKPEDSTASSVPLPMSSLSDVLRDVVNNQQQISETEDKLQDLLMRQQALMAASRLLEVQKMLSCITRPLPFVGDKPLAAIIIFRCCLHWSAYSSDASTVLSQVVAVLAEAADEDRIALERGDARVAPQLAYWLSVTSTLLAMTTSYTTPRSSSTAAASAPKNNAAAVISSTVDAISRRFANRLLFGKRLGRGKGAPEEAPPPPDSPASGGPPASVAAAAAAAAVASSAHEEPTSPAVIPPARNATSGGTRNSVDGGSPHLPTASQSSALVVFIRSLDTLVRRVYDALRDTLKRSLVGVLVDCVRGPASAHTSGGGAFTLDEGDDGARPSLGSLHSSPDEDVWSDLVGVLQDAVDVLAAAHVPPALSGRLLSGLLALVDASLTNQLLLRPECCSVGGARSVAEGVARLEAWLVEGPAGRQSGGHPDEMRHIRQATSFLMSEAKADLGVEGLRSACPDLSPPQLYRLCTTAWDEDGSAAAVSGEVLEALKAGVPSGSNGGLLVTCLVGGDEGGSSEPGWAALGGCVSAEVLEAINTPDLYKGIDIPECFKTPDCPPEVFAFLSQDVAGASPTS